MAIDYACKCHETKRTVSFTTSLSHPVCWCGLLGATSTAEHSIISEVPVILNAKFWKSRKKDIVHHYPELKSLLCDVENSNSYLYFLSKYLIGSIAGCGTFSKARRGLMFDSGTSRWTPVALKFYYRTACIRNRVPQFQADDSVTMVSRWDKIKAELLLQSRFNHPNVAKLLEIIYNPLHDVWVVVMEYGCQPLLVYNCKTETYRYPDSYKTIHGSKPGTLIYTEKGAKEVIRQVLSAVEYLHEIHSVIHKDIKAENVLLSATPPADWLRSFNSQTIDDLEDNDVQNLNEESNGTVVRNNERAYEYDGFSDSTEAFLWDDGETIEQFEEMFQVNSSESGKNYEGLKKMITGMSSENGNHQNENQSLERSALNIHLKINKRQMSTEDKIKLLQSNAVDKDNIALEEVDLKLKFQEQQMSVANFLRALNNSDVYCFCCGMHITESNFKAYRDWDYDENVDQFEDINSKKELGSYQNESSPIPGSSSLDTRWSSSCSIQNELSPSRCKCCRRILSQTKRETNIPGVESIKTSNTYKKRKLVTNDSTGKSGLLKLIDFNSAVQASPPELYIYDTDGSRSFTPPECFDVSVLPDDSSHSILGRPRDVWSIGCLLYCLVKGELPFKSETSIGLILEIQRSDIQFSSVSPSISQSLVDLIKLMLDKNPQTRITIKEILQHPWMMTDK